MRESMKQSSKTPARHILIVDDHTLVADMLELFLGQLDQPIRVSKAGTVLQALAMARSEADLSLVLLDLHMPDMDGFAGLRHLRQAHPDLPVVIISGDVSPATVDLATSCGARGFIPKTIGGPATLHALRLVLSGERYFPPNTVTAGHRR